MEEGETLLEFPCEFPVKAMGLTCIELEMAVIEIINRHVDNLGEGAVAMKPSRNGKYTAITITIVAHSNHRHSVLPGPSHCVTPATSRKVRTLLC